MPYLRRFLIPVSTCYRITHRSGYGALTHRSGHGAQTWLHVYVFGVLVAVIHQDTPR
jgi:hypothetical protein